MYLEKRSYLSLIENYACIVQYEQSQQGSLTKKACTTETRKAHENASHVLPASADVRFT